MKQLNNDENIYIIYEIKEKEKITELLIENYSLDKNNLLGKSNKKYNINLQSLDCQYLSNKLFNDNSLLLVGISSVKLYPNIVENINNVLSTKISFYYEKQYKIKIYQMNKTKYIITNGKTIILIEKNEKLLISKAYNRLNNISIISIINSEEEKDKFSGFLIKIKCLVSYDNNNNKENNGNINIQNFILPQFETEIIIDFKLIYFNLDENKLYKLYKDKLIIFCNKNIIFYYIINKDNKNINKLEEFKSEMVDDIKIIDNNLFIFYNNQNINIYKLNFGSNIEIKFFNNIKYNRKNKIILKRKIFYNKKEDIVYFYYIDYLLEQYFLYCNLTNKENNNIIEEKLKKENKIYYPNNYIKKKLNKTFIYYINHKHSVIFGNSFYNKIIINYKIFQYETKIEKNNIINNNYNDEELNKSLIILLTNYSEFEIYNFDIINKKFKKILYIIHLEFEYNNIIDYLMINENYLLLLNINSEKNILELNRINIIIDENNIIAKKEILIECKMAYNNLYYIKELNLLFINSNYGEISVYNIDSRANIEFINSFNYGYSSSEIIKIKNILSEDDFSKLFIYDLLSKKLQTFNLLDIHHILKYKENELFFFHLIIFLYKECFLLFIVMENKYTLTSRVLFGKQIKFEKNLFNNVKEPFNFISENLTYDIENHSFDFTIKQELNK